MNKGCYMKKSILILFGGKSCEHDISIISTFQCLKYFNEYLYKIILVYIDKNGVWRLVDNHSNINKFLQNREKFKEVQLGVNENILYVKRGNKYIPQSSVDVVFPIMHGINGEDGSIMGLLQMSNIPYVGCNHIASAIGIDKFLFKKVCNKDNVLPIKTISYDDLIDESFIKTIKKEVGFPCIIKPNKLGSSIGIEKCENEENFINLVKKSLKFDEKVVIEPYVKNLREFNVAIYSAGGECIVSEIEEPILHDEILSFKDKYLNFSGQEVSKNIPAKINTSLKGKIVSLAKQTYCELDCSGVVRVDFIYDKILKKLYINEINTIPGALSLYLFEANGLSANNVINHLIDEGIRLFYKNKDIVTKYDSVVFEKGNISKFNKE